MSSPPGSPLGPQRVPSKLLHKRLEKHMLLKLKKIFQQRGCLESETFRSVLSKVVGLKYTDEEFNVLFMKIDSFR